MNTSEAYSLGQKDGITRSRKSHDKIWNAKSAEGRTALLEAYNAGWATTASGADFTYKAGFNTSSRSK